MPPSFFNVLIRSHQIRGTLASEKMIKLFTVNIFTNEDTINSIKSVLKDLFLNNKASFSIILESKHYALTIKITHALLPWHVINRKQNSCFLMNIRTAMMGRIKGVLSMALMRMHGPR